jgi:lipopolysaccharide export LptBFGC system permease protein LptF
MFMRLRDSTLLLIAIILTSLLLELALTHDWSPVLTGWSVAIIFTAVFLIATRRKHRIPPAHDR